MSNEKRDALERALCRFYNLDQLDAIFYYALKEKLEVHVYKKTALDQVVFGLMDWLEQDNQKLLPFLVHLLLVSPWPQVKKAVYDYCGMPAQDPYEVLVAFGEPIIDRKGIKQALKTLFQKRADGSFYFQALITFGPRYCGRSHVKWIISYATQHENIQMVPVDLIGSSLEDVIEDLKNELSISHEKLSDAAAQPSRKIRNFLTALGGNLRAQGRQGQDHAKAWCLVFDHYDIEGVDTEAQELVDELIRYAINNPTLNLWIIVLGHDNKQAWQYSGRLLTSDLEPLTRTDVEDFLCDISLKEGRNYTEDQLRIIHEDVFGGLAALPLDVEGMRKVTNRLRPYYSPM